MRQAGLILIITARYLNEPPQTARCERFAVASSWIIR